MKRFIYISNILVHILLILLSHHFATQYELIWTEFDRLGWQNYNGPDLDSPANTYYMIWVVCSLLYSLMAYILYKQAELPISQKIHRLWLGLNVLGLVGAALSYLSDGSISLEESKLITIGTSSIQLLLSLVLLNYPFLSKRLGLMLKSLFLLQAFAFFFSLALGQLCLHWDAVIEGRIVLEEASGGSIYTNEGMYKKGFDNDLPENTFNAFLILLSLSCLGVVSLAQKKSTVMTLYTYALIFLLLYSVFIYINDGSFDMQETFFWWLSQLVLLLFISSYLFIKTKAFASSGSNTNVLDDLSHLD